MGKIERIGALERQYVLEALDGQFQSGSSYRFVTRLEKEFAEKFQVKHAIAMVNGTATLHAALEAAGVGMGDEVICPPLTMSSTSLAVLHANAIPVFADVDPDTFLISPESVKKQITPRTKAIILNSPNNPTGNVCPKKLLEQIAALAVEKQLYVISDEIYEKLIYDGNVHISIASLGEEIKKQTIVVNGVSKSYAMTGWRIGYAAGPIDVIKAMTRFQSHATSNPNSIAQAAAATALENGEKQIAAMVAEFSVRRDMMFELINGIKGLSVVKPEGAFYALMNISGVIGKKYNGRVIDGSGAFSEMLLESFKVAVTPGKAFGSDCHVRLSYATSRENIKEGLKRIADFVSALTD